MNKIENGQILHSSPSKPIKTVIIGNNREFFSSIDPFVPKLHKKEFVQSDFDETDMDIMWKGDNKLVVVPRPIDQAFTQDIINLFNYKNVEVVSPIETGKGLSEDIIADNITLSHIVNAIRGSTNVQVIPWGHTSQFQSFNRVLEKHGVVYSTPETPLEIGNWLPDYAWIERAVKKGANGNS